MPHRGHQVRSTAARARFIEHPEGALAHLGRASLVRFHPCMKNGTKPRAVHSDKLAIVFRDAVVLNAVIAWSQQCL